MKPPLIMWSSPTRKPSCWPASPCNCVGKPPACLRRAGLEIFPHKRLALYRDQQLRLSPKEFGLLSPLMQQPGRAYSRAELSQAIWPEGLSDTSNVLDVHFANLRGKLRDPELYGLLRTVRGVGYALRD